MLNTILPIIRSHSAFLIDLDENPSSQTFEVEDKEHQLIFTVDTSCITELYDEGDHFLPPSYEYRGVEDCEIEEMTLTHVDGDEIPMDQEMRDELTDVILSLLGIA